MGEDIGIRMSFQPVNVRDFESSEPDMIAGTESVHVKTLAAAHIREIAEETGFGASKIVGSGQLDILPLALKHINRMSGALDNRGIVGEVVFARIRRLAMRCKQDIEPEGLRRLHGAQRGAIG